MTDQTRVVASGEPPVAARLWDVVARTRVFDLAHALHAGMPQSVNHTPFRLVLDRRHGDVIQSDGGSMANETVLMTGHSGTHIDALGHVSHDGWAHGERTAADIQTQGGITEVGIDQFQPFLGRGVLLDVAAAHGVSALPHGYEVTVDDLELAQRRSGVEIRPGDAILIGTGWSRHWEDAVSFLGAEAGVPGPGANAARWLAAKEPILVGGETLAFEQIAPGLGHTVLPVHRIMLVENGVHIMEAMRLHELMDAGATEFTLVVNPIKLLGATGAPCRPLALV